MSISVGYGLWITLFAVLLEGNAVWKKGIGKAENVREGGHGYKVSIYHVELCCRECL